MPDAGGRNLPRATALRIRLPVLYIENYETRNRPPFCAFVLTMIWLLIAILAAFAALAIASLAGRRRFRQRVTTEVAGLYSGPGPEIGPSQLCARLDSLPAPVRRYLRYTVSEGAPGLMEVSWFPFGLLGDAIRFEPIDAGSARVSLATAGLAASAVMEVDEEGKLFRW